MKMTRSKMKECWYLLKLGDGYIILFYFVYVWIFHNKKWKRKTHGGFEHINFQPNRGPGQMGQRCEEQFGDGHKEGTLCFLTNWTSQSCCLLKRGPFLRDSLWRWLFIVPFDSAILVIADWPRDGVLNKGMYLYSRVSPSAHYWYFGLDNFYVGCCTLKMFSSIPDYPLDTSSATSPTSQLW